MARPTKKFHAASTILERTLMGKYCPLLPPGNIVGSWLEPIIILVAEPAFVVLTLTPTSLFRSLFETVLSLQPQVSAAGEGDTPEDKVLELSADVLKKIPDLIDYELTAKIMADDPSPLNVVLLQEV